MAPNKKNVNKFESRWKKKIFVASDKETCFNQDVFCSKIEERNTKRKAILPEDEIDFQSGCDSDNGFFFLYFYMMVFRMVVVIRHM